jgi:hypothetical protein
MSQKAAHLISMVPCVILLTTAAFAQQAPAGSQPERGQKFFDEVVRAPLIPARSPDEIRADIERAKEDARRAESAKVTAEAAVKQADNWVRIQKAEVDLIKKKMDAAKKDKRETDRITLEGERKKAELLMDFLNRRKNLSSAELDLAKAEKELAEAKQKAYEQEREFAVRREARDKAGDAEFVQASVTAADTQEKAIRALKAMADSNKEVADREKKVFDSTLDLFEVRRKLVTGLR